MHGKQRILIYNGRFHKDPTLENTEEESDDDALPYFAPLDYAAYATHSEHDYSTAANMLRTAGIIAAIAGGVFMPPVALAAPVIAMSGSVGEPKPVSDIPVRGGVKVVGQYFSAKVPLNHDAKEGLYYITIWASIDKYSKPIAISRRAILASLNEPFNSESVFTKVDKKKQDGNL